MLNVFKARCTRYTRYTRTIWKRQWRHNVVNNNRWVRVSLCVVLYVSVSKQWQSAEQNLDMVRCHSPYRRRIIYDSVQSTLYACKRRAEQNEKINKIHINPYNFFPVVRNFFFSPLFSVSEPRLQCVAYTYFSISIHLLFIHFFLFFYVLLIQRKNWWWREYSLNFLLSVPHCHRCRLRTISLQGSNGIMQKYAKICWQWYKFSTFYTIFLVFCFQCFSRQTLLQLRR